MTCTTHHNACECREARFTDLQKEVERLREMLGLALELMDVPEHRQDEHWYEQRAEIEREVMRPAQTPPSSQAQEKESSKESK